MELAKRSGSGAKPGFLNAVLRGCLREREGIARQLEALKKEDPATGYAHPAWLVERWQARWGAEKTAQLMDWNNAPPPTFARLNGLKTDAATLTERWKAQGIGFTAREWDWTGGDWLAELESHPSLAEWDDFQRGFFYVQDPSTLLAVHELNPQPGENILDVCAAPGGKTACLAQRMENRGHILARDIQPQRLRRLRENCERLGVTCVEIAGERAAADAGPTAREDDPGAEFTRGVEKNLTGGNRGNGEKEVVAKEYDRVLVDAPCSNSGVLRRRVDLRWRIRAEELERLRGEQAALLREAAVQVKPGGLLVYSTCSLEPEENETVTREFLAEQGDFTLESERQLLPFRDRVDGAYVAALRRRG